MTGKLFVFVTVFLGCANFCAQTISGNFSRLAGQDLKLEGFSGLKTYPVAQSKVDSQGNFRLSYTKQDTGVGYLTGADHKPLFLILSGEDVELHGETPGNAATVSVTAGEENKSFEMYATAHPKREQALSAWIYLEKMYTSDSLFIKNQSALQVIQQEKKRINEEDAFYVASLSKDSYVRWFLPQRKLVSSVSVVAQYRAEEIPATIAAFRTLNYTDGRLYKSGLLKDAVDSHFWLLENSGKSLGAVFTEMKVSIDALYRNATKDDRKLNEVTNYLFDLLESHSLLQASEYLAVKVLNEAAFSLDQNLAQKLETYRVMKKGNTAPDILFKGTLSAPGYEAGHLPKKLSDLKTPYTVVIFGAGWCPQCAEEIPEIARFYPQWKNRGVEVVFVSLDENKEDYSNFVQPFPFISTSDFKKWESKPVKDYHVFATPTMYLLDAQRKIILKPVSAKQIDSWLNAYATNGH